MAATKILVVGAIQGHLEKAFQKIAKLQAKQNFSFAIVVGDVFANPSTEDASDTELKALLDGSISVPLPTYFTVGDHSLPEAVRERIETSGEVCSNLFYLGRKGTLKTSDGIRIVNVGGRLVQNQASLTQGLSNYDPLFLDADANTMRGANQADILVTNRWPARIHLNSNTPVPDTVDIDSGSESLARLCTALRPRYFFVSCPDSSSKWEREPFLHPKAYEESEQNTDVTRFFGLAGIDAPTKEWMYAFTLDLSQPPSTNGAQVISPLTFSPKRKRADDSYSRYDNSSGRHHQHRHGKRPRYDPNDCFMCMGRPGFRVDMVVSISDESFVTVLKGPLPLPSTFSSLQSSGHSMIIPMFHAASETSTTQRSLGDLEAEFQDMSRYRHALNKMMSTHGLGAVCWEVNRTGIRHLHWQHLAVPLPLVTKGLVEAAFKVAAEKATYPPFESCDSNSLLSDSRADYFRVWVFYPSSATTTTKKNPVQAADDAANGSLPSEEDNGTETSMFFPLDSSLKFNIGFGRDVLAGLLQLEDRVDWRNISSQAGEEGEEKDAEAMKVDFAPFDAAMQ